ncbi:zinc finger protein 135-like [Hypomesus transpacificus]|uniref:zinc finger protein 135-like n=1 Tax=Hypomesus transpacificus TaxID=137520 RepID=UPI001F086868|nr:zinc finger protein 135-like [Hypomesus transpacificus]
MSQLNVFRDYLNERLTTAALEIFAFAEKSFAKFEEEIYRSKEESLRLQRLLDIVTQPAIKLHRTDVLQLSLLEPQQIKEEQELWTSQEEEQLQGLQSETTHSMFTSTSVKHDWDQEDFSECSHLDQTVKVENREGDSLPSNTTEEQINAELDGQDCAAPEPGSDSHPLSVVFPNCFTAQSLEKVEHEGVLLLLNRTQDSGVRPRENMPQRRHTGKTLHQCQHCNKTFSRKGALVFHMGTHTEDTSNHCQQCNKCFAKKGSLVKHLKTHTGEKPYHCQQCNKLFAEKGNLVKHMKTHTGEKPFQCQECSKLFARRDTLREHIRTHTREKPYKCQLCNKSFTRPSRLVIHMRAHTGEKPYQCQQCNIWFRQKYSLVCHMRTHTGEKPFKCQKCSEPFSKSSALYKHMRTHIFQKELPPTTFLQSHSD